MNHHPANPYCSIDIDTKTITLEDGTHDSYDKLISTMPLDILILQVLQGSIPLRIKQQATKLKHSGGYIVGVGLKGKSLKR